MATFRQNKTTKKWRAEISMKGIRKSATFQSQAEAKEWAREEEYKIERGFVKGVTTNAKCKTSLTVNDVFMTYKEEVAPYEKNAKSLKNFCNDFAGKRLLVRSGKAVVDKGPRDNPIAEMRISSLDSRIIRDWLHTRQKERNLKNSTYNRYLALFNQVLNWAVEREIISANPTHFPDKLKKLKTPKKPIRRRVYKDEIQAILNAWGYTEDLVIKTSKDKAAVLWLLSMETGMRQAELADTEWKDIDLNNALLFIPGEKQKNGESRSVPLTARAIELIKKLPRDYYQLTKSTPASVGSIYRRYRDKVGGDVKSIRFHDTRHEAISRLANVLNIFELMESVGHQDANVTQTYYHNDEKAVARKVYNASNSLKPLSKDSGLNLESKNTAMTPHRLE